MRSTDERMAAVSERTRVLKRRQKQRRGSLAGVSVIAVSLALVVGLGFGMPGIMTGMDGSETLWVSGMASIFSVGTGLGYVLIGVIAFTLGVCVTMLCLHLHHAMKDADRVDEDG